MNSSPSALKQISFGKLYNRVTHHDPITPSRNFVLTNAQILQSALFYDIMPSMRLSNRSIILVYYIAILASLASCTRNVIDISANSPSDSGSYQEKVRYLKEASEDQIMRFNFFELRHMFFLEQGNPKSETIRPELFSNFNQAIKENNSKNIVKIADLILQIDFTDIRVHVMKAQALRDLGEPKAERFHRLIAHMLFRSIIETGDGKSFSTAWHVYRVKEEYDTLKMLGFFTTVRQSLATVGDRSYDILQMKQDKTDEVVKFYFDVTDEMNRLNQQLGHLPK